MENQTENRMQKRTRSVPRFILILYLRNVNGGSRHALKRSRDEHVQCRHDGGVRGDRVVCLLAVAEVGRDDIIQLDESGPATKMRYVAYLSGKSAVFGVDYTVRFCCTTIGLLQRQATSVHDNGTFPLKKPPEV
jgi:hypothetical protein